MSNKRIIDAKDIEEILEDKELRNSDLSLKDINDIQTVFERKYWDAPKNEMEKTRHICLHIGKLLGKISHVCEKREHNLNVDLKELKEEVIPDLLCYALMLAESHNIVLQDSYLHRLEMNIQKINKLRNDREKGNTV